MKTGWLIASAGLVCLGLAAAAAEKEVAAKKNSTALEERKKQGGVAASPLPPADDAIRQRMAETLRKMEKMDKDFRDSHKAAEQAGKSAGRAEMAEKRGERHAEVKEKKEKEKEKEKHRPGGERRESIDPERYASGSGGRSRVYYSGHEVQEGGWTEIGGSTSSARGSSSSIGGYRNEGGSSSSSIGVRATIIRLDGPDE